MISKKTCVFAICLGSLGPAGADTGMPPAQTAATHPLDPLSAEELLAARGVLLGSGKLPKDVRFPSIALKEPPKAEVYRFTAGQPFRREALAIALDRKNNLTYEAVVDLRRRSLTSFRLLAGVHPMFMAEEYTMAQDLVRKDARWQAAIQKRGIKDDKGVALEPWATGLLEEGEPRTQRMMRVMSFYMGGSESRYARPIEGLVALVDLTAQKVLEVVDSGVLKVPPDPGEYAEKRVGPLRQAPKALVMSHPEGPSFVLSGNEVRWQKWRFRVSMNPREGLVLHMVGYEDGGKVRPVLYRGALSEMVVPYSDPDRNWRWRSAFDVGEYGIGALGCSLVVGADVPSYATTLDVTLPREDGSPRTLPRAIGIYERDGGLLWRHWDYMTDVTEARRSRELAVSFMTAVGNYDYMLTWVFRQDGSLSLEADLSGIMLAKGVAHAREAPHGKGHGQSYGHLVAPHVSAIHHQHFFVFRLDMDVDGAANNTVLEMNSRGVPMGEMNPRGNVFLMETTPLRTEAEGQRDMSLAASRKWLVVNPTKLNALGAPTGFMLVPGENSVAYADPASPVRKRAGFLSHHLWVTRYAPGELHAAGDYPNQNPSPGGLPVFVADNQPIENQDVVLWYNLGVTHIPRPEEWPIMSVHRTGFTLLPAGFITRNPALDVPPPR